MYLHNHPLLFGIKNINLYYLAFLFTITLSHNAKIGGKTLIINNVEHNVPNDNVLHILAVTPVVKTPNINVTIINIEDEVNIVCNELLNEFITDSFLLSFCLDSM